MKRDLYVMNEVRKGQGVRRVGENTARLLNARGYGVFWTVNEFDGPRRKENLVRLNSWYVEMDDLDKSHQLALIEASPVVPNLVIESKNGFHVYWNCREARVENYDAIQAGIRHFFFGDPNAKDVARILRAPGFKHWKDPENPYPCEVVWTFDGTYSERIMAYHFPTPMDDQKTEAPAEREVSTYGDEFWERVYNLNCADALFRLSGHAAVNGEKYDFHPVANGNLNIYVNGQPTSAFIDKNGRIGSSSKGGPSIWQWLKWYGHSNTEVYRIIADVFPEIIK